MPVITFSLWQARQNGNTPLPALLRDNARLEPYLAPLIVAGLSLLAAMVYERGEWLCRKLRKKD